MLKLSRVCVQINDVDVLRNVSMEVPSNSFVALVGRNGAGKTTLMRSVMGLVPIASGEVWIDGTSTSGAAAFSRARNGVGYLPEDRRLVPDWSVAENIQLPAWACGRTDIHSRLQEIFALIPELAQLRHRKSLQLSGGQQKLVALARALMASRKLLILDEPFEGVAPALVQRLIEILSHMRRSGSLSVLISDSQADHSMGLVDAMYAIERGHVARA